MQLSIFDIIAVLLTLSAVFVVYRRDLWSLVRDQMRFVRAHGMVKSFLCVFG